MTDVTKARIYQGAIVVLVIVIAAIGYKFIVAGTAEKMEDGRMAIRLESSERALILREMREFVVGLQAMADGLARDDMKAVAQASRAMGGANTHDVPVALMGKLLLEFKALGLGLHRDFDAIAVDADGIALPGHTLRQLADAMHKCVACHNAFQISSVQSESPGH